jgi:hypothetical protein
MKTELTEPLRMWKRPDIRAKPYMRVALRWPRAMRVLVVVNGPFLTKVSIKVVPE